MSPQHCYYCNGLSSSGITRPQRYYAIVRLPVADQQFLLYYRLFCLTHHHGKNYRVSRVPVYSLFQHAIVFDPGEAMQHWPVALHEIGFHVFNRVALPISEFFRGSIRSAYAYGLLI